MAFAVAVTLATPEALVVTVVTLDPENVALAPEAGAVKVTGTPDTGLLLASSTVTCRFEVNALLTVVDWLWPPVTVMLCANAGPAPASVTSAAAIAASIAPRPEVHALAHKLATRRGRTGPAAKQSRPRMIGPPAGLREPFAAPLTIPSRASQQLLLRCVSVRTARFVVGRCINNKESRRPAP